ncbi:hypothetical protein PP914_gp170 [Arthrobacter phage Qui]|jgi:hypothetical protein|uniref:Uncharacterized protein n=1 Tax=Arthrobacter phage Qui TaxID=2603260 RepID=A0A5B8WPP1_9CAUD|nr:hypothetical protein PP914_gp170 [Arthrobacter phage Qui]QED11658.1 hypothetical protein SEA_QUI_170 [Arthrobacter phage Qui]QOC56489.1 hypothetical protein SEA_PAELLA_170 [Arthrobacter phage Paella]
MNLLDGALGLFLGLLAVGFIILLLRKRFSNDVERKRPPNSLFAPRYVQDWERNFSWAPVRTIDQGWVWLRVYWRRKIYSPTSAGAVDIADKHGNVIHSYTYQNVAEVGWYLW